MYKYVLVLVGSVYSLLVVVVVCSVVTQHRSTAVTSLATLLALM